MSTKSIFITVLATMIHMVCLGQKSFHFKIIDHHTSEPLVGATAYVSAKNGGIADSSGIVNIPYKEGESVTIQFSFVGYDSKTLTFNWPFETEGEIVVRLTPSTEEMEEVIVTSTRSSRNIEDVPTRIEFLGSEELEEKSVMKSANIAMLLRESTGIQMQITSPSSANQSIRIQGLDGRYTQLLKDGFPLYGGFSGGLSIMQIPPLDLQQVEVIKGSNSTLYGAGAIAGLVNLVSIRPEEKAKFKLMLDQTTGNAKTINSFYAKRSEKFGMSLFASVHKQKPYDVNDDDFSDLPDTRSLTFNPTFFYYPNTQSELRIALNGTFEDRLGGNLNAIEDNHGNESQFLQKNFSTRLSYQLGYTQNTEKGIFKIKNSLLNYGRKIYQNDYSFKGQQWASFSETSYSFGSEEHNWTLGANFYTDKFDENNPSENRDYSQNTIGLFAQQTQNLSKAFFLESGIRFDYSKNYGWFALPRISLMIKQNQQLTYRIGGGLGYKLPTIFTEETERKSFYGLKTPNLSDLKAEKSYGGNFDINYKTALGKEWTFSLNQLFFYTRINNSLLLNNSSATTYSFVNANAPVISKGTESNLKLTYKDFKFFLNYAFINAQLKYETNETQKPLTPKHNIGAVLVYEEEGKWRVGLEAYYKSSQLRNDLTSTKHY